MNAPAPAMKPEHMDFIVWYLFSVRGQFTLAFSDYETINLAMGFEPGWKPELIASMRRLAERGCLRITPCIETRDEVVTDATPIHTRVLVSHPDNADSIRRRLDGDYWLQKEWMKCLSRLRALSHYPPPGNPKVMHWYGMLAKIVERPDGTVLVATGERDTARADAVKRLVDELGRME